MWGAPVPTAAPEPDDLRARVEALERRVESLERAVPLPRVEL
jgi:hypothetical protein